MVNEEILSTEEKAKEVKSFISGITKKYGNGSLMLLEDNPHLDIETFSSGSLSLDYALGGGIPKGRIIEVFGPESSGKTTLTLHMIAEVQKNGGMAGFIDAEHALDPVYAKNIGVDVGKMAISQPDNGEQGLSIAEEMVSSKLFDIIVIDSVAALVPKRELEGDMGDANVGLQARLMSQALRKLTAITSKSNCTIVFINQLREKVGVMFGSPETTTGGRALKFYASVRLDVRKKETLKTDGEATANHVAVKVVKNKIAPPFRTAEFDISFGKGIEKSKEVCDISIALGIIKKSGAFYYYGEDKVRGMEALKEWIAPGTPEYDEVYDKVIKALYEKNSSDTPINIDENLILNDEEETVNGFELDLNPEN